MAVAGLVLGIVSIVFSFIGLGFPIGAILGIVGIILSVVLFVCVELVFNGYSAYFKGEGYLPGVPNPLKGKAF